MAGKVLPGKVSSADAPVYPGMSKDELLRQDIFKKAHPVCHLKNKRNMHITESELQLTMV